MFTATINWVLGVTHGIGYSGIIILMAIESSFLPLPSELVIPPAAWLASQGQFNIFLLVICGVIGSVIGASVNYLISWWLGRLVIYKLADHKVAHFFRLTPKKVERAEKFFLKDAAWSTFIGRLIPVIRHLISIPAGFCRMPYGQFVLFTALGSLLWTSILAALGYFAGANQALLTAYFSEIKWGLLFLGAIWIYWAFIRKRRRRKKIEV
jgi:membrane protein DedA with SNARE-associated domain